MDAEELAMAIDELRSSGVDMQSVDVVLYDHATGQHISTEEVGLDGDGRLVIKFDYEG